MRVISGKYKGRKLEAPEGMGVRPTTDKVREAIFDIIMNEVYGSVFCDLFAGSGAMGIEALSRGASFCYFCDSDRDSLRLVRTNISYVGAKEKSRVIAGDYKKALRRIDRKVDIFFIDPPYQAGLYESCLSQIEILDLLSDDGIIIAEHDTRQEMPEDYGVFTKIKDRRYGRIGISIYTKSAGL